MRALTLLPTLLCTVFLSAAAQAMTLRMLAPGDDVGGEVTMVQIALPSAHGFQNSERSAIPR